MKMIPTVFAAIVVASLGFSSDQSAEQKLTEALRLYRERTEPAKLAQAVALLEQAESEAESAAVKFDVLVTASRQINFQGLKAVVPEVKKELFQKARTKAKAALVLGDFANAYYWDATNLGRWAEVNGIFASLAYKDEIMKILETLLEKETKDGSEGETYESYGADRILGRLYFKLPGFAGGSRPTSLKHLKRAYDKGGNYALNAVYYAETLASGGTPGETNEAKRILEDLLKNDPMTFNTDRIPETQEEFEVARRLKSELGL